MADSKTQYSTNVNKVKKAAESSKAISKKLKQGQARASDYMQNWQSANINDAVNKFAPGAINYVSNGKIVFSNGGRYAVVADVAGGYFRIQDTSFKGKVYVTLDGKYQQNFRSNKEFDKKSHYRILKREEMK